MHLEVAFLAPGRMSTAEKQVDSQADDSQQKDRNYYYPGVFLSSQVSRFVRPVKNLIHGGIEWIGPLE